MTSVAPYLALAAAFIGFCASSYIRRKKRARTAMVCPLRGNCDKVLGSTHATTLGIPNELLGMAYYFFIGTLYALRVLAPETFDVGFVHYLTAALTILAALFSLYLVALQAVVIRAWCTWCVVSALMNAALAACLWWMPTPEWFALLAEHRGAWAIVHALGFVLGLGGATITDVFFFRFLKDHRISEEEKGTLDALSRVVWVGLAVLLVSGLMLYLPEQARLAASPKFLLKVVVVAVVLLNGIALNLSVAPRLRLLSFERTPPARTFRRLAFALGGISIASWYTAFLLGSLRHLGPATFAHGLFGFGVLLAGTVVVTQVFERLAVKHASSHDAPSSSGF